MTYVAFFAFTSIFAGWLFRTTSSRLGCIAIAVLMATFAALRGPDVASDFIVYEDWYVNRDLGNGFLERPGLFEAVYFLLNDFFVLIGIPFRFFIGFLAFTAVFMKTNVIVSFAKSGRAIGISVLIYAFTFYLLHDFTQIRAGLAIAFIFFAVRALVDGKRMYFVLLILLATGFHSSALMASLLLLPHRGSIARGIDWGLFLITGGVFLLAMRGVAIGAALVDVLTTFDPRIALYVSLAEGGQSEAANPFAVSALLLLALALSLAGIEFNRRLLDPLDEREELAIVLVRRSILIGLSCLVALSPIPEIAMRVFEINIALLPILAAIVFSHRGWLLQKSLLLLWTGAIFYVFIVRDEGLVRPYVFFSL